MLIYFETSEVEKIVEFMSTKVTRDGLLCVGISETSGVSSKFFKSLGHASYGLAGELKSVTPVKNLSSIRTQTVSKNANTILVVEDEEIIRMGTIEFFKDEGYDVIGAANVKEAIAALNIDRIGLILCDHFMPPGKTGTEFCSIARDLGYRGSFVLISGGADLKVSKTALSAGCNDVRMKPCRMDELLKIAQSYISKDKAQGRDAFLKPELLLFGASTGGTQVLCSMLKDLPASSPPVLVVQHIAPNFAEDFAKRLSLASGLPLGDMTHNAVIEKGKIYVPCGDYHLGVARSGSSLRLIIDSQEPINSHRPSVDFLFNTASNSKVKMFAALMTGMGRDGAQGLHLLSRVGAETCAQDEKTSTVFGMPREAIRLGAASFVGTPDEIRDLLNTRLELKIPLRKTGT